MARAMTLPVHRFERRGARDSGPRRRRPIAASRHRRRCTWGTIGGRWKPSDKRLARSGKLTTEFTRRDLAQTSISPNESDRVRVIREGVASYLPDIDPEETGEWLESFDDLLARSGPSRARYMMLRLLERAGEQRVSIPALTSTDYVNTIPTELEPWFPGDEAVERRDHGAPRSAPGRRRRRPHLHLRVVGRALRGRLQPLLPRQVASRRRGPGVHPGPRLPRHLCPRLPRGPAHRRPARRVPPGAQPSRRRAAVVSAPAADARLLGVPDGFDGAGSDQRDLSGPVQPLPARPRHQGHLRPACVGVPR